MFAYGLLVGLFVGGTLGVFIMALCFASSKGEDDYPHEWTEDEVGVWKLEKWGDYVDK